MSEIEKLRAQLDALEQVSETLKAASWDDMMARFDITVQGKDFTRVPPDHDLHDAYINWNEMRWMVKAFRSRIEKRLGELEEETA